MHDMPHKRRAPSRYDMRLVIRFVSRTRVWVQESGAGAKARREALYTAIASLLPVDSVKSH